MVVYIAFSVLRKPWKTSSSCSLPMVVAESKNELDFYHLQQHSDIFIIQILAGGHYA